MGLCINFLKLTVSFTLIFLVFNWVEMCEREKGLIGNYFSESGLTTEHIKELLDMLEPGEARTFCEKGKYFCIAFCRIVLE